MSIKVSESMVTFERPFRLNALDPIRPAGTYRVSREEEEDANSRFRKITYLRIPSIAAPKGLSRNVEINPYDLAVALREDERQKLASGKRLRLLSSAASFGPVPLMI